MSEQQKPSGSRFTQAYDRVLKRLRDNLDNAEEKSWEFLQDQIEEAVEIEQKAAEMSRDELDLLSAYVKRDLRQLGRYTHLAGKGLAEFLDFDLGYLEDRVKSLFLDLADRTRIEQEILRERLDHDDEQYIAGELATVGTLECLNCGSRHRLLKTVVIEPCQKCGGNYFKRVSAPLADDDKDYTL
ncbi:zinc ribbon-containing protein [Marinobacterium arenosum]|uniref:zinc ribbon-containing protein n=1 Tax=Marinobacterium arenosum TaxID=2862496 RepID=UPI001C955F02|nr:zinc ribbon-containing protein [Marinobacterium arenosum]MBY4676221.1 zinc ribbon-containing protein [Marinobacterium arenosum]